MINPYLLLWLEAPLQAWGHDSKFGRRDSLDFPTKSGVLGLICCARGVGGPEREWLGEWADLDMQVRAYGRKSYGNELVLRQPLLRDFQMVGSGYDKSDEWEDLHIPKKVDGKSANTAGTKMTYRYYVQDMAYGVVLEIPREHQEQISTALITPVWDLYLGRKCCVPTEFIFQGVFESVDLAIEKSNQLASAKERLPCFKVLQGAHDGEVFTLNDVPIQFGINKRYRDRQVTVVRDALY